MNTKLIKITIFLLLVATTIFLGACAHTKEDNEKIIKYLDKRFGKDAYTIKQDKYHPRWFVTLKKYPDIRIYYTVSRNPLSMSSPAISTDFDNLFGERAVKDYEKTNKLAGDKLSYDSSINFVYYTRVKSLEDLRASYDRFMYFVDFVREKYPIIIEEGFLEVRMDIDGIKLKGLADDDSMIYQDICQVKKGELEVKSYQEIYKELSPKIKTHLDNPDGLTVHADIGRSFILGSDTLEDCLYKNLVLKNARAEDLKSIVLQPGELSPTYTFKSDSQYEFTSIDIQAKNLTDSTCSLLDATIVKATIDGGKNIFIDPKWIDLIDDQRREWKDPYEVLKISPPRTEEEKSEGVRYKNIKILFVKKKYFNDIGRVVLTYQK